MRRRRRTNMLDHVLDLNTADEGQMPLPDFIEHLYFKHFGKDRPDTVISIEERARRIAAKKAAKRAAKLERKSRNQTDDGQRTPVSAQNPKSEP